MKNKYYTPKIKDFYPGYKFEYKPKPYLQIQTNERGMEIFKSMGIESYEFEDSWRKGVFNESVLLKELNNLDEMMWSLHIKQEEGPTDFHSIKNRIEKKAIRTRYLNKEDIESLGWIYNKNDYAFINGALTLEDHIYFYKPNYRLIWSERRKTITLFIEDVTKLESEKEFGTWVHLQEFPCKSVNELKKIMEWLKIE